MTERAGAGTALLNWDRLRRLMNQVLRNHSFPSFSLWLRAFQSGRPAVRFKRLTPTIAANNINDQRAGHVTGRHTSGNNGGLRATRRFGHDWGSGFLCG